MITELSEFIQVVDEIYGFYLDTIAAYRGWRERLIETQKQISQRTGMTIEQLDKKLFAFGKFRTEDIFGPDHVRTQHDIKKRNKENGVNYAHIANVCIVMIYQYWEYYRKEIEDKHELKTNSITSDLMGDVRFYRISILHNKGISTADMNKCRILGWFKENDKINLTKAQFESIIKQINQEMVNINRKYFE